MQASMEFTPSPVQGRCRPRWACCCCGLWLAAADARAQEDPPGPRRPPRGDARRGLRLRRRSRVSGRPPSTTDRCTQGDRLSTAGDARAELRIGSTTLHLGSSAELDIVRLDDERLQFALLRGSLGLRVRSSRGRGRTGGAQPRGPFRAAAQRAVPRRPAGRDQLCQCLARRIGVPGAGAVAHPAAGPARRVLARRAAARGAQPDAGARWTTPSRRLVLLSDQADTRSAATTFVSPEMTGVEDLDRFGGWQQHPEYGAVWTPTTVAVGWVPYRHGQWVWLRPWGWTWVDDAPWGFAPFHYGRWVSWGGRWCWSPGPRVARPVYAPALVAWAGGPQFKVHMGSRQVPAVGWVPLAPREHYRPSYRASPGYLNRLNAPAATAGAAGAGHGNRHVPGAVTVLPTSQLAPRQPVAAAALRADETQLLRPWQAERFQFDAPGRPAYPVRDAARPRAAVPLSPVPQAPPRCSRPATPARAARADALGAGSGAVDIPRPTPLAGPPVSPQPPTRPVPPAQALPSAAPMPAAPATEVSPNAQLQSPRSGVPIQAAQPLPPARRCSRCSRRSRCSRFQPVPPAAAVPHGRPLPPAQTPAAAPAPSGTPFFGATPRTAAPQAPARERARVPAPPQGSEVARPLPMPTTGAVPAPALTPPAARAQAQPTALPAAGAPPTRHGPPAAAPPPAPAAATAAPGMAAATARPVAQPAARAEPAMVEPGKGNDERGERRRTPDSRQLQRER